MKIIFMGSPDFSVPALDALVEAGHDICAVYCQPPRPAGRGKKDRPTPVQARAAELGLTVRHPGSLKGTREQAEFAALDADIAVVVAYGLILPQAILDAPKLGCVNIHASLLPRWRGAAPIHRAIMAGDESSGITIMRITPKLDAGPVWHREPCDISASDTGGSLHDKLAKLGAVAITEAISFIVEERVVETKQDESLVTYADKITAADRELEWPLDAISLERHVRALNPVPVATTSLGDQQCKIWRACVDSADVSGSPGTVAYANRQGIGINTGHGILRITELQPPGKKPLSAEAFVNGYGDRLSIAKG